MTKALMQKMRDKVAGTKDKDRCQPEVKQASSNAATQLHLEAKLAGFATYDFSLKAKEIEWSAALQELLGSWENVPADLAIHGCPPWLHPDDSYRFNPALEGENPSATTVEFEQEYRVVQLNGISRWVLDKGNLFYEETAAGRRAVRRSGVLIDITARKSMEQTLQYSLKRLQAIFEHALDAMLLADDQARYIDANPAASLLLGFTHAELLQLSVPDIVPEDARNAFPEMWREFMQAGVQSGVVKLRRKDGGVVDVDYRAVANVLPGLHLSLITDVTNLKLAEKALRESEERFRTLAESMPHFIWEADAQGVTLYLNPAWYKYIGASLDETLSINGMQYWHPDDSEHVFAEWKRSVTSEGAQLYDVEARIRRHDGVYRWFHITAAPVRNAAGEISRWVGMAIDIEARKHAEQELRDKDERLIAAMTASGTGTFHWNITSNEFQCDEAKEKLWDAAPGELSSIAALLERIHIDDRTAFLEALERATHGQELDMEYRILHANGQVRWIAEKGKTYIDRTGRAIYMTGACMDITERKQAEEARVLLAAIVETSTDAIVSTNLSGQITSWNSGAELLYGYGKDEAIGQKIALIIPGERADEHRNLLAKVRCGEKIMPFDTLRRHKDGRSLYVSVAISPVCDERGAVVGSAGVARDISRRKQLEERLHRDAFHDKLTGLPNRALLMDRLAQAIARAQRVRKSYAVLILDIDNFKLINDSFGHLVGDELLYQFAQRVGGALRPEDTFARFGGDEFIILLADVESEAEVVMVAERILAMLQTDLVLSRQSVHVKSSIGIALGDTHYMQANDVLRDADTALYEAKRRGKGQYVFFNITMRNDVVSRLQIETELRNALAQSDLSVAYQPIIDIANERIMGCEALSRWQHDLMGPIEPSRYICIAEETGLIIPLGRSVLEAACQALASWLRSPGVADDFYVSVNLSPKEVMQQDMVIYVADTLKRNGLHGKNLRLEITESVIIQHEKNAAISLNALRDLGIQVCMDDFGTGYSSLSYLHQFPVDVLKVDRSFITELTSKRTSREITRTILGLAQTLDIQAVAEGAETYEQLELLRDLGFRWAQGFILHQPMDRESLAVLLTRTQQH